MSLLHRISPWHRGRAYRTSQAGETRATRDALAANIAGLARAMEERFATIAERIDTLREAQSAEAERAAAVLGDRVGGALNGLRSELDARLDKMASEVSALSDGQDFARVLRDLKRDLGAQISLSSFETAAEIRDLVARLDAAGKPAAIEAVLPL